MLHDYSAEDRTEEHCLGGNKVAETTNGAKGQGLMMVMMTNHDD